ncbi:MAG: glycosyltransferase family 61 protein, partial [Polyangiaceae bacterium]|nr:glycosyltransferase family 61 protein [Polyangiaceae bacterium]
MASRAWVVSPGRTQVVPKAVYIDETLGRATAAGQFSDLADQYELISGRKVFHRPTRAYALERAALVGSSMYVRGHRMPLAPESGFRARDLLESTHVERGALGCTYFGNMFFGHFWTDDVPLMQLGSELGEIVRTDRPPSRHQRELLELLDLKVRLASSLTFDELIVLDDCGQTEHKERRYRTIRRVFATKYERTDAPRGVFLFRGTSGSARLLVNEREIADALTPHGIVPVHPERLSLDELNQAIWGARLIVGVEGSQMLHGFYNAAEGASFLTLNPPYRFSNILKSYTDCLGMSYGFVLGEPCEAGFRVRLDEVL